MEQGILSRASPATRQRTPVSRHKSVQTIQEQRQYTNLGENMGTMERILRLMGEKQASDVYLAVNAPALIKINGECVPINNQLLPPDAPRSLLAEIVPAERLQELDETGELNMGVPLRGVGRFRVSAMHQRGSCAVVIRFIAQHIPPMDTLNLPPVLGELIMQKRGLLLVVGSTGSGKSTTLASMIDARNEKLTGHILTIEDPIEYQFRNKRSIVNQREVGSDTASLQVALKNALRQAPDVILIGEIRDRETMSSAMGFAQSGHLCLATLHANNSYHALNRILSFFPEEIRPTMLGELSAALKGVISQRLVRTVDGGRMPAVEVMLNTKLIADLIERGNFSGVKEAMEKSMAEGSQTFEEALAQLVRSGRIDRAEALAFADSPTNLMWRLENDVVKASHAAPSSQFAELATPGEDDMPSFTEIMLEVKPN